MPTEKIAILVLAVVLLIQTVVIGWLGFNYWQVQAKLESQQEPVKTPAMLRKSI